MDIKLFNCFETIYLLASRPAVKAASAFALLVLSGAQYSSTEGIFPAYAKCLYFKPTLTNVSSLVRRPSPVKVNAASLTLNLVDIEILRHNRFKLYRYGIIMFHLFFAEYFMSRAKSNAPRE